MLTTFLFAILAVAAPRIRASQVTMDAKIRDDSDLSQVSRTSTLPVPFAPPVFLSLYLLLDGDVTSRMCATTPRVLGLSRRNDRAPRFCESERERATEKRVLNALARMQRRTYVRAECNAMGNFNAANALVSRLR